MGASDIVGKYMHVVPEEQAHNHELERAKAQMRSDIAAEVRLREEATGARDQAIIDREGFERSNLELATQNDEATRSSAEFQARAQELTGTVETQRKDIEDLTRMVQEMTSAQAEANAQLTLSFATIDRERSVANGLLVQLQESLQGHKDVMSRVERIEGALRSAPTPTAVEPPEYEFIVAARDANGRAAKYHASPVKKS